MVSVQSTKTIIVLGCAYAGTRSLQVLASSCPPGWRVLAVDRATHFNHLYAFPRVSVLPGHEFKALIPQTNIFHPLVDGKPSNPPGWEGHRFVHARAVKLEPRRLHVEYLDDEHAADPHGTIDFDFLIYGVGASLPPPINLWGKFDGIAGHTQPDSPHGTKPEGCRWLIAEQERIRDAESVCIVGGGALGVQYAGDIADVYPGKKVTLCHSRHLLPLFDKWMHEQASEHLKKVGVDLVLGTRVNLDGVDPNAVVKGRTIQTHSGQTVPAELILICTGQNANSHMIREMAPLCVSDINGTVFCKRSMQLADAPAVLGDEPTVTRYPHIFVAGDLADAFGALNAGHTAWAQGEVAAKNVLSIIKDGDAAELSSYTAPPYAIKVSLGLRQSITQRGTEHFPKEIEDTEEARSLYCYTLWQSRGLPYDDMHV